MERPACFYLLPLMRNTNLVHYYYICHMPNIMKYSLMNPVRLVKIFPEVTSGGFPYLLPVVLAGLSGKYIGYTYNDGLDYETRLPHERKDLNFCQPWQLTDEISMQLRIPDVNTVTVWLYNCQSQQVATITPYDTVYKLGDFIDGVQMSTYCYRFAFTDLGLNHGKYYVVAKTVEGVDEVYYRSELFDVRNQYDESVLVEYEHSDSGRYDIWWDLNPRFCLRVIGYVAPVGIEYQDTDFTGQQGETSIPYSDMSFSHELVSGHLWDSKLGAARWFQQRLANALRCDYYTINGQQFVRKPNQAPEIETHEMYPTWTVRFPLLEQNVDSLSLFGDSTIRYEFPTSYPYMISFVRMVGGNNEMLSGAKVVNSSADISPIATYANTLGLKGSFVYSAGDNSITYTKGRNDRHTAMSVEIMFKSFDNQLIGPDVGYPQTYNQFSFAGTNIVIDWGDGTIERIQNVGGGVNPSHEYAQNTEQPVFTVWHNDNIVFLNYGATDPSIPYSLKDFKGPTLLPTSLEQLYIEGNTALTLLHNDRFVDYDTMTPNLTAITIKGSVGSFSTTTWFDSFPTKVTYFDFSGGTLDDSDFLPFVAYLDNQWDAAARAVGYLNISGQTPAAPPGVSTQVYLSYFTNAGAYVVTD